MMSQRKINLTALLALVLVTLASTYDCPEDCHCVVIQNATPHNHAKCTSLKGLMESKNLPIHSIDLSNIGLTRIPSHQLEKLRDLTTIDLSHNELSEVGRLGRRVKSLNLKHNRITSGKLAKIPQLIQHLDLSHNELTYLPLELTKLSKLRTIELTNNQINCSCETLEVRNWLQEKHIYTENPVKCVNPVEVKSKPWLQVKQSEICEREKNALEFDEDDEENELMLGDQPAFEGSGEVEEEELGKDFMPLEKKKSSKEVNLMDEVEGSGDLSNMNMPLNYLDVANVSEESLEALHTTESSTDVMATDEEDGSGSGMGPLIIPRVSLDNLDTGDDDVEDGDDVDNDDDEAKPSEGDVTPASDIFGPGLGIAQFNEPTEELEEVSEMPIVPAVFQENEASEITTSPAMTDDESNGNIEKASIMVADDNGDSKGTYVLLGVIVLIVMALIMYVGIKRCKANDRARSHDIENPRSTELMDMDKKNLGKPIHKNGHEHAPLIGEKKKEDFAKPINGNKRSPYENEKDINKQEPLLNGDSKPQNEANNNVIPTEQPIQPTIRQPELIEAPYDPNHRIIPRYPPPKSPRASKQNYQGNDDVFLPSSPKMGRYSPVYSPETGKVKIKLTEMPKPKTPMLVTRSKSNAGDIITTPVVVPAASRDEVGIHQPTQAAEVSTQQEQHQ